jgi:glutathione S-transferase
MLCCCHNGGPATNRSALVITLHHLNDSRSQRILWLLEELGLNYDLVPYQRDPVTNLAPPELKKIHPLGKSPVLVDGALVLAESAAIVEYLARKYGSGKLAPEPDIDSRDYIDYLHWMHFAEGSAMLPLLLKLYVGRLGDAGKPLWPRIDSELHNYFGYMNDALGESDWFVANRFSAADIQLSFVVEAGAMRGPLAEYSNLVRFKERFRARPAYQRALARGGPYKFATA